MRPRYLEIEGLQSFKTCQKIDFDKLSETGLFGIFGPTGSGKSTILDAITLALYGSVYRAAKGTQGIINTDMGSIKVVFTFDLIKAEGRKTYRVERFYKRKKDTESSIEAKVTRLVEVTDVGERILADKHSDVNNCVVELVGLKFEDFTRSVVLPQNKFQEFLLSPRGEKTKMLERIFYLEEYGKQLGDKVNRQMAEMKNRLSNLEGALSSLGNASPEALIEGERKLKEAQQLKEQCLDNQKKAELRYTEGMELYKLSKEYIMVQQQLQVHKERQGEIDQLKIRCQKAETAQGIKTLVDAYREAKVGFEEALRGMNTTAEQLKSQETEKEAAQRAYDLIQTRKEQRLPELIQYKTVLQQCTTLDQEVKELSRHLDIARKDFTEIKDEIDRAQKLAEEKIGQRETLSTQLQELEHRLEELAVDNEYRRSISQGVDLEKELQSQSQSLQKHTVKYQEINAALEEQEKQHASALLEIKQCNAVIEDLGKQYKLLEASKPMDRQQVLEQQSKLFLMENSLANRLAISKTIKEAEEKLAAQFMQLNQLQEDIKQINSSLDAFLQKKQEITEEIKRLQLQQTRESAAMLAKELVKGEACPVCGSKEHPHPTAFAVQLDADGTHAEQQKLQEALEALDKIIREQEHKLIKLEEQQKSLEETRQQVAQNLEMNRAEYIKQGLALPEQARKLQELELHQYIESQKQVCQDALAKLQEWELAGQRLQDELKKQEGILSEAKIRESRYRALLDSSKAALQQEGKQLEELKLSIEEGTRKYQAAAKQLGIESFSKEALAIQAKEEQGQVLQRTVKQQRNSLDVLMLGTQKLLEKINETNHILTEKKAEGIKLRAQKEEKEKKIVEILQGKKLEEELCSVDIEIRHIEEAYKAALESLNKINEGISELQKSRAAFLNSHSYFSEKLEGLGKQLQQELNAKGFQDAEEAAASLLTDQALAAYQEELRKYERIKGSLEDRIQAIAVLLEGRLITDEQWQELSSEYENAKAKLEEHISMLEAARSSYQVIKENFERWLKLQEELQTASKKKDLLEQIQKLLKGNAFIEFISEERMRYIAREATETLGQLTKFKYSIELDSENGFVIRDNANGGVLRSVASLSGGETFLTSLSLALALSSQLQLKGQSPLEFFFLDEGFGTLDNALLDTVMDSLERLSSSKRVMGLISHVPEMKNRISRRLVVEPPDRLGNGSRISMEKA